MPGSGRSCTHRIRLSAIVFGISAVLFVLPTGSANAQNLLESLFGARQASAPAPVSAHNGNSNPWAFLDRPARQSGPAAQRTPAAQSGPRNAYCVRLCDGRYFPLPRNSGNMTQAQTCSSMCPAAETRVFNGTAIERAVGSDGKPYAGLKTAYAYREKTVDNCTCTRGGSGGVAATDAMSDPTLRRGDIVVTRDGPMVYTGTSRTRDREQAFVPADEYAGLPKNVRAQLAGMQIARDPNETASLPASAAPATLMLNASERRDEMLSPVAEAFASFEH
jgi:hypothetical protein